MKMDEEITRIRERERDAEREMNDRKDSNCNN